MGLPTDYRGLLGSETRPLNEEEMCIMMNMMSSPEAVFNMIQALEEKGVHQFLILKKRLMFHNIEIDPRLLVFLSFLCRNPGQCVMWAYTLKCIRDEDGEVTMDNFCTKHFPMGIPEESVYEKVWDAQKISSEDREELGEEGAMLTQDNWLDRVEVWQ